MVRFISNVKKEFPNMYRVVIYKEPITIFDNGNKIKRNKRQVSDDYIPSFTSINRTRTTIRDLILANDFDLFVTFTFDPDKIYNRYSYICCMSKITRWIHNQHLKSPDLIYLFVPEQHKDGAWHFHGLLGHYNGSMKKTSYKSHSGDEIYNITSYRGGFSTATYISDKDKVATYIGKYITKDVIKKFNQRRFFCSKGLNRPIKTINAKIDFTIPFKRLSSRPDCDVFEFPL